MALTFASYLETAELPPVDECVVFKGVLDQIAGDSSFDTDQQLADLGANYNDSSKANFEASGAYTPAGEQGLPGEVPEGCDASAEIDAF
jgi:hypothetical protein